MVVGVGRVMAGELGNCFDPTSEGFKLTFLDVRYLRESID